MTTLCADAYLRDVEDCGWPARNAVSGPVALPCNSDKVMRKRSLSARYADNNERPVW